MQVSWDAHPMCLTRSTLILLGTTIAKDDTSQNMHTSTRKRVLHRNACSVLFSYVYSMLSLTIDNYGTALHSHNSTLLVLESITSQQETIERQYSHVSFPHPTQLFRFHSVRVFLCGNEQVSNCQVLNSHTVAF